MLLMEVVQLRTGEFASLSVEHQSADLHDSRDVGYGIRNIINSCSKNNYVGGKAMSCKIEEESIR